MIPADTLTALDTFVRWSLTAVVWASVIILALLALRWMKRKIQAGQDRAWERAHEKWAEPETHGDDGGRPKIPLPADYSDEVTDEHFKRIANLVDQDQFKAPETGSGRPDREEWD